MSIEERGVAVPSSQDRPTQEATAEQRTAARRAEAHNMELMQTLDDAWNAQDMDTFAARHKKDVVVRWPGKEPTQGVTTTVRKRSSSSRPFRIRRSTIGRTRPSSRRATGPAPSRASRGR